MDILLYCFALYTKGLKDSFDVDGLLAFLGDKILL